MVFNAGGAPGFPNGGGEKNQSREPVFFSVSLTGAQFQPSKTN